MEETDVKIFYENDIVVEEGRGNDEMYLIVSGSAAVYFGYGTENEYFVGVLSPGRCIGETGFLTGKPSPFTVVAVSDLMLEPIGKNELVRFIQDKPEKAVDLMKNLARTTVTMSANVSMLRDELLKALGDKADTDRINAINKSILRYRVSGLQGSPYFDRLK